MGGGGWGEEEGTGRQEDIKQENGRRERAKCHKHHPHEYSCIIHTRSTYINLMNIHVIHTQSTYINLMNTNYIYPIKKHTHPLSCNGPCNSAAQISFCYKNHSSILIAPIAVPRQIYS